MPHQLTLNDEAATDRLGHILAKSLPNGTVVALIGPLGAGKTRLVQAAAVASGIPHDQVTSPTFVIVQEYRGHREIIHADAFRLADADEFLALGADEFFNSDALVFIEWADRVGAALPENRLEIQIEPEEDQRRSVTLAPHGQAMTWIAADVAREWARSNDLEDTGCKPS